MRSNQSGAFQARSAPLELVSALRRAHDYLRLTGAVGCAESVPLHGQPVLADASWTGQGF